jgi:hypothetical protein
MAFDDGARYREANRDFSRQRLACVRRSIDVIGMHGLDEGWFVR